MHNKTYRKEQNNQEDYSYEESATEAANVAIGLLRGLSVDGNSLDVGCLFFGGGGGHDRVVVVKYSLLPFVLALF